jgi:hypothetical protein
LEQMMTVKKAVNGMKWNGRKSYIVLTSA